MSLTKLSHNLIKQKYSSIEYGVDATCGNGYDTLFLAELCSGDGMIYSFDIQEEAIDIAEKLLHDNNLPGPVLFINSGHEKMEKLIKPKVDIVMFNLGFLPNSDSEICTKPETTIPALESACKILKSGGIVSILCYPGTAEGRLETEQIGEWLNNLDKNEFGISEHLSENPDETTPLLYVVEKR